MKECKACSKNKAITNDGYCGICYVNHHPSFDDLINFLANPQVKKLLEIRTEPLPVNTEESMSFRLVEKTEYEEEFSDVLTAHICKTAENLFKNRQYAKAIELYKLMINFCLNPGITEKDALQQILRNPLYNLFGCYVRLYDYSTAAKHIFELLDKSNTYHMNEMLNEDGEYDESYLFGLVDEYSFKTRFLHTQIRKLIYVMELKPKEPTSLVVEFEEVYRYKLKQLQNSVNDKILSPLTSKIIDNFSNPEYFVSTSRKIAEAIMDEILRVKFKERISEKESFDSKLKRRGIFLPPEIKETLYHLKNRGNIVVHPDKKEVEYTSANYDKVRKEICERYLYMLLEWFATEFNKNT